MNSWGEVLAILSIDSTLQQGEYYSKVKEMARTVTTMLARYLDISTSIAISAMHNSFAQLGQAYLEACQGLRYSFYCQGGEPVFYTELEKYRVDNDETLNLLKINRLLSKCLDTLDKEGLETLFKGIIKEIESKNISRNHAYDLCYDLISVINTQLKKEEVEEILIEEKGLYGSIDKLNNKTEVINWITNLRKRLIALLEQQKINEHLFLIGQAKKYIHQHFSEDISLNDVARVINISPGYLSSLFKEVEEVGFNEYITGLRIEEAKRLLRNSNEKIYQISEMIGYNNPYYFSRVFKRMTGQTPSEFRAKKY
jgi:two-component system response regulator YesN